MADMDVEVPGPSGRKTLEWEPVQHLPVDPVDLRMSTMPHDRLVGRLAPKGWKDKKKRERAENGLLPEEVRRVEVLWGDWRDPHDPILVAQLAPHVTDETGMGTDLAVLKDTERNAVGVGSVSGRAWKVPAEKASKGMRNPKLATAWEKKMAERSVRKAFVEHKRTIIDDRKQKLNVRRTRARPAGSRHPPPTPPPPPSLPPLQQAERKRREALKQQKQENREKSSVVQKITNSATVKRMMKDRKQRKLLRTADTTKP